MNTSSDADNGIDCEVRHNLPAAYAETHLPVSVSIYENEIPPFVEIELERLYDNIYSTLARLNIYGAATNASTYVARKGEVITAIFIFREERNEIKVINQQIEIDVSDILMFVKTIFSRYQSAKIISFYAINANIPRFPFPFQKFPALEENVIFFPATSEEYIANLSANFRYQLRAKERKLKKDFPTFRYEIFLKLEVSEQLVREIIRLTYLRMATKKKAAYIDEADIGPILQLIRAYGAVSVATIDGRICAGNIVYRVGRRNHLHVLAHDPAYDQYMLGNQMIFWTMCECIKRGGRECWLMAGGAYKLRFLAYPIHLDSVVIFRSRAQFLLNLRRVSKNAARLWLRRTRQKLVKLAQGDSFLARLAAKGLNLARSIKRFCLSTAGRRK